MSTNHPNSDDSTDPIDQLNGLLTAAEPALSEEEVAAFGAALDQLQSDHDIYEAYLNDGVHNIEKISFSDPLAAASHAEAVWDDIVGAPEAEWTRENDRLLTYSVPDSDCDVPQAVVVRPKIHTESPA